MTRRHLAGAAVVALLGPVALLGLGACTNSDPGADPGPSASTAATTGPSPSPGPTSAVGVPTPTPSPSAQPTVVEPTTTNTLPPPPRASRPAPSTAGPLSASSLPVPDQWRTAVRTGGSEAGFEGNGTWVRGRDPRYAAQDIITLGCADVTRDDYPDPTAALEGSYERAGQPGIGLVLQFADEAKAKAFYTVYTRQVRACSASDGPVVIEVVDSDRGLIDRRTYPDGDWTEVGALRGTRLTLVILSDPGHRITRQQSERLLAKIDRG